MVRSAEARPAGTRQLGATGVGDVLPVAADGSLDDDRGDRSQHERQDHGDQREQFPAAAIPVAHRRRTGRG